MLIGVARHGRRAHCLRRAPVSNRNHYQNVLGLFPKGWRVPLTFRRDNAKHEILVRLMGAHARSSTTPTQTYRALPSAATKAEDQAKNRRARNSSKPSPGSPITTSTSSSAIGCGRIPQAWRFQFPCGAWTLDAEFEINQKDRRSPLVIGDEKRRRAKSHAAW